MAKEKERMPSPWHQGMPVPSEFHEPAMVQAPWEKGASYEYINPKAWYLFLRDELSKETLDKLVICVNSAQRDGAITESEGFELRENLIKLYELMNYTPRSK